MRPGLTEHFKDLNMSFEVRIAYILCTVVDQGRSLQRFCHKVLNLSEAKKTNATNANKNE